MDCQFEEKQYEQHLNNELIARQELLYVPGQVLEGQLGFDAAAYSINRSFWKLFDPFPPYPFFHRFWLDPRRSGVQLCREWWDDLEKAIPYFPRFRFNVFVQHKRPEYLTTQRSNEWEHWNTPYYRFALTSHQQKALEQLENRAAPSAIVVYASPAFIELETLWQSIERRQLIEKSNFCQPSKLIGHHLYTYNSPGNQGKAHSESEDVESFGFYEHLSQFGANLQPAEDNRSFLIQLGNILQAAIEDCGRISEAFDTISHDLIAETESEFHLAMSRISAFTFVVGIGWLVGVEPR